MVMLEHLFLTLSEMKGHPSQTGGRDQMGGLDALKLPLAPDSRFFLMVLGDLSL